MKVERIIDSLNETNIYIMYDETNGNAIVIDSSNFKLVDEFIEQRKLHIDYVILTHEHFDHILGLNELHNKYDFLIIASQKCSDRLVDSKLNLSSFSEVLLYFKDKKSNIKNSALMANVEPYSCKKSDIVFENETFIFWNNSKLELFETPGHSKGSISIIVDNNFIFTGDSLLKELNVITRFPGGSTKEYIEHTLTFYKTLDSNMIVYPGHGEKFLLKDKWGRNSDE